MESRKAPVGWLAVALMLLVWAGQTHAATVVVEATMVGGFGRFVPDSVVIHPGDTVQWKNMEMFMAHTSTSGTGSADPNSGVLWNSGSLGPGGTFKHVFNVSGAFDYYCIFHELEGMFGKVVVCDCPFPGDADGGGSVDVLDVVHMVDAAFSGGEIVQDPLCQIARDDFNSDGSVDVLDVVAAVDNAFSGGPGPVNPC